MEKQVLESTRTFNDGIYDESQVMIGNNLISITGKDMSKIWYSNTRKTSTTFKNRNCG